MCFLLRVAEGHVGSGMGASKTDTIEGKTDAQRFQGGAALDALAGLPKATKIESKMIYGQHLPVYVHG